MFLEVNKRQGKRTDLTSNQAEQQLEAGDKASDSTFAPLEQKLRTHEKAAEEFGESIRIIRNALVE